MEETGKPNAQFSAPETVVAPTPAVPAVDPKMEALARQQRVLFKRDRELKAREEAIAAKEREYQTNYVPKSRIQEDPLAALNELGLDYQKLTELQLQNPNANDPTIRALMSKLQKMEERFQTQEQSQTQWQEQQNEQHQKQLLADIKHSIGTKEEFELINTWGAYDSVVAEMDKEYEKTGIVIDISEAAKRVEDGFFNETIKALGLKKIQNYKKPEATGGENVQTQEKPKYVPSKSVPYRVDSVRTLTNNLTQDTLSKKSNPGQDRLERAMKIYNGVKD